LLPDVPRLGGMRRQGAQLLIAVMSAGGNLRDETRGRENEQIKQ
jgi:hypothetical protein